MITTAWPYLAIMLLAAGLFPSLERGYGWRVFGILPPIVWTYLLVTALAVAGLWQSTDEIKSVQRAVSGQLLPALLFLLMVTCDLRAIIALGPRVLFVSRVPNVEDRGPLWCVIERCPFYATGGGQDADLEEADPGRGERQREGVARKKSGHG